jgi:hypothetical protein
MMLMLIVVVTCVTLFAVIAVRALWPNWKREAHLWFDHVAAPVLFPPRVLGVAALQRQIVQRALASVTVTVSGRAVLPSTLTVLVSPDDAERIGTALPLVESEVSQHVAREARKRRWRVTEPPAIYIVASDDIVDGRPQIRSSSVTSSERARTAPARTLRMEKATTRSERGGAPPSPSARTQPLVVCELIRIDAPGQRIDLTDRYTVTIGRLGNDVDIAEDVVSESHAQLVREGDRWLLQDRSSTNGTWVNGSRVDTTALIHNDEVRLAMTGPRFIFSRLSRDLPALGR